MYFGSFFNYTNEEPTVPTSYRICFSEFLSQYRYSSIKKQYLHIWLDILDDFSKEDIDIFFSELKEHFSFKYEIKVLTDDPGFDYEEIVSKQKDLKGSLEVGEPYLVLSINTFENTQGVIKLLYHISRMLHEANCTIDICKRAIKLKRELSEESMWKLLKFSNAVQSEYLFERHHTIFYLNGQNSIKDSLTDFKVRHIHNDCFDDFYIEDLRVRGKDKDIEELVILYKSL